MRFTLSLHAINSGHLFVYFLLSVFSFYFLIIHSLKVSPQNSDEMLYLHDNFSHTWHLYTMRLWKYARPNHLLSILVYTWYGLGSVTLLQCCISSKLSNSSSIFSKVDKLLANFAWQTKCRGLVTSKYAFSRRCRASIYSRGDMKKRMTDFNWTESNIEP